MYNLVQLSVFIFVCVKSSPLQPVRSCSKVSDVIGMEIEVKGSTEPYQVLLEPYAIVIPGDLLICTTIRKQFKVIWNSEYLTQNLLILFFHTFSFETIF